MRLVGLVGVLVVLSVSLAQALVPPRPASCPPTSLCVERCCPPGQVYQFDSDYQKFCTNYTGDIQYEPEIDQTFRPRETKLLGEHQFKCKDPAYHLVGAPVLYNIERFSITSRGQLRVYHYRNQDNFTSHEDFDYGDFCVAFVKTGQSDSEFQYEEIKTTYSVCYIEAYLEDVEDYPVYPGLIFISDIFVFLTLAVYLSLAELRNNTFGRITIGFLFNVFFSFLLIGIHYSLDIKETTDKSTSHLETLGCQLLGYLIQHTSLASFFWMSAMSIYITRTVLNSFTEIKSSSPIKTILVNSAYAQGSALFVSLITVIMDTHGNPLEPSNHVIPNIGKYSCWLGSEYTEKEIVPFTSRPEFLYYYLICICIILINTICFLRTGFSLFSHWWQMRGLAQGSINELFKTQVVTLVKLFFIMGRNSQSKIFHFSSEISQAFPGWLTWSRPM